MKKLKLAALAVGIAGIFAACSGGSVGEVIGVSRFDGWTPINPYGMNYIKFGSYTMGLNDEDITFGQTSLNRTVSVPAFYIDDTEISNTEYRQFIEWVKDSVVRSTLADNGIEAYYIEDEETGEISLNNYAEINWEGEEEREALEDLFIDEGERFYGKRTMDVTKLNYEYYWVDYKGASVKMKKDKVISNINKMGGSNPVSFHNKRSNYIIKEVVNVYPDTLAWVGDFVGGNSTFLTENYFWHPAYDDYPLVGVTWGQANAFNVWRTRLMNGWKAERGDLEMPSFRLPTETEWEYAARGGLDLGQYPWGGPYLRNRYGCPLANFKPLRGDYLEDGAVHTAKIDAYESNDYGLYNMSGNVAEWTASSYDESVFNFTVELNPDYTYNAKHNDLPVKKRKVVRGGSWKDIPYYLQCGSRTYEYQDSSKCYIGFRSAMSYLGRGVSSQSK